MSTDRTLPTCAICGGGLERELLVISKPDRFERHLGVTEQRYQRRWIECSRCGAAANEHAPGNRALLDSLAAGYYEVDFAGTSIADKFARIVSLPPEESDNAQRVTRIHAFMSRWRPSSGAGHVLDIGAGTGVFLWCFLKYDSHTSWTGVAVEPDAVAAAHLRTVGSWQVVEDMFTTELGLQAFDLVTLNKVVEHVGDPVTFVREAGSALLPESGVLYVEVPDRLTLLYRPPDDNILGALHCHLYDPVSLSTLLTRAGLTPLRVERVFEPSGKITVTAFAAHSLAIQRAAGGRA